MISENTKNLREMIVARALSSTIVNRTQFDNENEDSEDRESSNSRRQAESAEKIREDETFSAADILQDWFETYEK